METWLLLGAILLAIYFVFKLMVGIVRIILFVAILVAGAWFLINLLNGHNLLNLIK